MTEIILVRHGQANSGATDEAGYDRLSPLGFEQAGWLGGWMAEQGRRPDRLVTGSLRRQRETGAALGLGAADVDPRFDEMRYFDLAEARRAAEGVPVPTTAHAFATHLPETLAAWSEDRLAPVPERYADFADRVTAALGEIAEESRGARVVVVTSGGVIGMALAQALGLDVPRMAAVILKVRNTSCHVLHAGRGGLRLEEFNATPHLAHPSRVHALTHV